MAHFGRAAVGLLLAALAMGPAEGGFVASSTWLGRTERSATLRSIQDDVAPQFTQLFISPCGEPFRAKTGEPYPVVVWFNQADTDHDGKLDRGEFIADAMRFFEKLDANGDGVIDSRELYYYEHITAPEIMANVPPVGRVSPFNPLWRQVGFELVQQAGGIGGLGGPPVVNGEDSKLPPPTSPQSGGDPNALIGAAPYGLLGEPEPVAASDLSFAGHISRADFKTRADQRFDILDSDQLGYLTLAGLPKTRAQELLKPRGGRARQLKKS
jgi:hypothetical protein